ncbi:RNA methyltransferase [Candidatus Woesearchaeota archaeon]|nr:RNA methyltransferase [Candidatus Woesearchaeota archaeon]
MISVILIEPENPGNIGAIARIMKNFDSSHLVLIDPKADPNSDEARARAMHGRDVLASAEICGVEKLDEFDLLVATTAQLGTDYNLPRCVLNPSELAEKLASVDAKSKIGIVFGRESNGLTNNEISRCDFSVSIQSSKKYPVLNLSVSAAIVLYEIFLKTGEDKSEGRIRLMDADEKKALQKTLNEALDEMIFSTEEKRETQEILWKRLFGKAMITRREYNALMGFLKKITQRRLKEKK